eukprot:COSAG02_NODE_56396_length_284_cov_4.247312_1_plen_57_part_10
MGDREQRLLCNSAYYGDKGGVLRELGGMAAAVAKVTQHSSDAAQRCAYTARDRLQHG